MVRFARLLYRRYKELTDEAARFLVVGTTAFLLTVGGTNALHSGAGLGPLIANVIANIVAACFAFAGHRNWTFRHRANSGQRREFTLFFLLNAAGLAIQQVCIAFTRYLLGYTGTVALNLALLTGICLGTVFRFWSYRTWVFLAPAPAQAAESAQTADPARTADAAQTSQERGGAARQAPRSPG